MTLSLERLFFQSSSRKWTVLLALLSLALLWFLSRNHSFVPMWVEGMGECVETNMTMLGYDTTRPGCWLQMGPLSIPLSMNSHIGPAWFYLYAPTAYLWFKKFTTDPYIYRYTGIVLFLANGWILYFLLRKYFNPSISFYSAAAFLTSPLLLLCALTDFEFINAMTCLHLMTVFLFSAYIKGGGVSLLLASAMTLGMTLLTRTEVLVWLVVPFVIYLLIARPRLILDRWNRTKRKPAVVLAAFFLFCLGALPVIAYNLLCPESNVFSFTINTVLRRSIETSSMSLWGRIALRIEQFWNVDLLNLWPMYELGVPNYVLCALWIVSACIVAARWITKRHASLLLVVLPTVVVMSVLTTGGLRNENLIILEPATLLVITSALAYVEQHGSLRKMAHAAFIVLILGNIAVAAMDWRRWNELPSNSQTMLNQSDPVLLASYLSEHHAGDRILYTNVGIPQYMKYLTVGRLRGEDIMDWAGIDRFINTVKLILLDASTKRVFVAVSKEHDGRAGAAFHTNALYSTLDQYNVPYNVTPLSSRRNSSLYDLIVIDRGVTLPPNSEIAMAETISVSEVRDVGVDEKHAGERQVIGSVIGTGFRQGDVVRVNGHLIVPTFYGNEEWITFSIPLQALGDQSSFTLELLRLESFERSRSFTVRLQQ